MDIRKRLFNIFKNKIIFSFICGSHVETNAFDNDIDILCCVNSFNKKEELQFRETYFSFHKEVGAKPDIYFPGELMTLKMLEGVIELAKKSKPIIKVKDKKIYDGLVWAGMIVGKKKILAGEIPEKILSLSHECIKKWNKCLFNEDNLSTKRLQGGIVFEGEIELKEKVILNRILQNKDSITKILLEIESYETIEDEFFRSIDCLKNIKIEKEFLEQSRVNYISAFFPVNLPLYSLIIFGFVPSLMSKKIFIGAPEVITSTLKKVKNIIFDNDNSIYISQLDRNAFVADFVKQSEVILFTGRYPSIKMLEKRFPNKLIIYNGAGINPIVVNKNTNMSFACDKIIHARTFNGGQDCAGPDAILVHTSIYKNFLRTLKGKLKKVKIGDYENKKVKIGKLLKPLYLDELENIFKKEYIVFGGRLNKNKKIIYPTIISKPLKQYKNYVEFFSPIFWVAEFKNEQELRDYFESKNYCNFAMYVSVFGDTLRFTIPDSVVLKNKIVMDVERGNLPYGGYGKKTQFISYKGIRKTKPILISKEISQWKKTLH